jgi:hypothetical protein
MTDEQMRIKIAEACGWSKVDGDNGLRPDGIFTVLPDYLNDRNACAEFEATLTDMEQDEYYRHLVTLCNEAAREQRNFRLVSIFYQITATARQRSLAFLKTKGILP